MKRLLWAFPVAMLVFLILQMTHTGPANLWAGLAIGVLVLFGVVAGLRKAGRR